jgi:hypothetical protein
MEIQRCGAQPSAKGPADYFTGDVRIDWQFQRPEPSRLAGALVDVEGDRYPAQLAARVGR